MKSLLPKEIPNHAGEWSDTIIKVGSMIGVNADFKALTDIDKVYDAINEKDPEVFVLMTAHVDATYMYAVYYHALKNLSVYDESDVKFLHQKLDLVNSTKKTLWDTIDKKYD